MFVFTLITWSTYLYFDEFIVNFMYIFFMYIPIKRNLKRPRALFWMNMYMYDYLISIGRYGDV